MVFNTLSQLKAIGFVLLSKIEISLTVVKGTSPFTMDRFSRYGRDV
jgi:hypothetical protein